MEFAGMVEVVKIATSALNLIAFMIFAMEAMEYREKIKEYDRLMREAQEMYNDTKAQLSQAKLLGEKAERLIRRNEKHELPQTHTARKYGAEYIRKPMREARIIPGTRHEEFTRLYANEVRVEWEDMISYEAELDGELIKVVERA